MSKETLSPTLNERHMVEFTLISSNFEEEVLGGRSSSTRHTGTVRTCGMKPVPTYLLSLAWTFYCRWGLHAKNAIILPLSKASQAASTTFSLSHVIRMCVVCLSTWHIMQSKPRSTSNPRFDTCYNAHMYIHTYVHIYVTHFGLYTKQDNLTH